MIQKKEISNTLKQEDRQVMIGAEPFYYKSGDKGCLLVHGISGTPQAFHYIAQKLADHGISALGVRLKGHGTNPAYLHNCTYQDWIDSALEGLHQLTEDCSEIYCVGLSMGGLISLHLASIIPEKVKGVVVICSPYRLRNFKFKIVPLAKWTVKTFPSGPPSINDPQAVEVKYNCHSVPAVHQLVKLTALVRRELPLIEQRALIFGACDDRVVDSRDPALIYEQIGSLDKKLVWLKKSQHVATLDYDRDLIVKEIVSFINSDE